MSAREAQRRAAQRALSLTEFCDIYGCTRTRAFAEMKSGRLQARKPGKTLIITVDDAEAWLQSLPVRQPRGAREEATA